MFEISVQILKDRGDAEHRDLGKKRNRHNSWRKGLGLDLSALQAEELQLPVSFSVLVANLRWFIKTHFSNTLSLGKSHLA